MSTRTTQRHCVLAIFFSIAHFLSALIPIPGYNGIKIAYGGNALIFILGLHLLRSIKGRSFCLHVDHMLYLDKIMDIKLFAPAASTTTTYTR